MKILVADDDPKLNKLVCAALREAGYQPEPAFTIADARDKLTSQNFDLALLDWTFDGESVNGIDLIKEITAARRIPILLLTGRSALADRVTGLQAGADDYLIKPFYLPELLARVKALLRRPSLKLPTAKIQIGPLLLKPNSFEVWLNDKPIALRKKEFQLLLTLIEDEPEIIDRGSLGHKIWGEKGVLVSNAIDVHVKSLRDRLGRWQGLIETVRGIGYRFNRNFKPTR